MSIEQISGRDLIAAIGRSQKVTNALAKAVAQIAVGDVLQARDTLEEVADLAKEAEWALASMAYNAGLVERG